MRKIRYAVIGLGNIAQVAVLPAFAHASENAELVALISSDREKLLALSEKYNVKHTGSYDEIARVLRDAAVDAVYIALPNTMHRPMTEICARLGVHVLCEKPMAMTVEDCEAMIDVTREAGVKLMVAYRLHFEEANLQVIERIRSGEIGEPRLFSSVFSQHVRPGDIRTRVDLGGGANFDMGIYCVNAARYLFRDEPLEVFATQHRMSDSRLRRVDETTTAILTFSGGRIAQITSCIGAAPVSEFRVVGTAGDVRLDPAYNYHQNLTEHLSKGTRLEETSYARHDQFAPELVYFSKCILEGRDPEPGGEEGLCDVRVLRAIEISAMTGQRVRLNPYLRKERPDRSLLICKPPVAAVDPINAPSPSR